MRQADLVVATGSQTNVRAAYESGTPALGVGAGNVAVIVDETADVPAAAAKIARSKTFDHATSCSSENSVIAVAAVYDALRRGVRARGRRAARCRARRGSSRRRCSAAASSRRRSSRSPPARSPRAPGSTGPRVRAARFLIVARDRRRPGASVLRREALAGAGALSRRRLRRRRGARRAAAALPGRRALGRPAHAARRSARCSWGSRCRSAA